jgi:glycosyltransferase involved in cell wall biosynthesis
MRKKISVLTVVRELPDLGLSPVCYYRAHLPVKTLDAKCPDIDGVSVTTEDFRRTLAFGIVDTMKGKDIYVLPRLHHAEGFIPFVEYVHEWGGKVIFDTDDDLTDDHRRLGSGDHFKFTAAHSDHVTVSTAHLAKRMEQIIGYKPSVLPNQIYVPWFRQVSLKTERINPAFTVGFVGTSTHYGDWKFPVDALLKLAKKYPEIVIGVAGYFPDYLKNLPNSAAFKPVPYINYPGLMRQFDVVCCSLDPDDEFNKCKSAVKALESMASARTLSSGRIGGAVPVCTNMPVYRRVVQNRNNGLLVDNDDWYDALERLVRDRREYNRLSMRGHKWVTTNRNMDTTGWKWWASVYRKVANGGISR